MRSDEILVAVPTRGQVGWATVTRLQEVRDATPGLPPILYQPGNLSVALTRNKIVKRFLAGPWKALAMVDDDIVPPLDFLDCADALGMLSAVAVPHPMPAPSDPSRLVLSVFDGSYERLRPVEPKAGVHACAAVATGCIMIARHALEALAPCPFRIENDPDAPLTSDDFLFCADLSVRGFRVGYRWTTGYANHHTVVGLAELCEAQRAATARRGVA